MKRGIAVSSAATPCGSTNWHYSGCIAARLLVATILGLPQLAFAQLADHIANMKRLPALEFPVQPVESAPRSEPEMAVYKPAGPGPFAAVVIHHTCGGVQDHIGDSSNELLKAGYVVLVLDSLSQRGARTNCGAPLAVPTANGALDAYQALEHLAGQSYVDNARVGFVGFSWGGMVALLAAQKDIAERLPRARKELRFRAIAAVYPHCFIPSSALPRGLGT